MGLHSWICIETQVLYSFIDTMRACIVLTLVVLVAFLGQTQAEEEDRQDIDPAKAAKALLVGKAVKAAKAASRQNVDPAKAAKALLFGKAVKAAKAASRQSVDVIRQQKAKVAKALLIGKAVKAAKAASRQNVDPVKAAKVLLVGK